MKITAALLLAFSISLCAAEFWENTPFEKWSDKEVHRILTSSPWAHQVSFAFPGAGRDSDISADATMPAGRASGQLAPGASDERVGGGGLDVESTGGRGGRGRGPAEISAEGAAVYVRWDSALPVRQALSRTNPGDLIDPPVYRIAVTDVPPQFASGADPANLAAKTAISVKGRSALNCAKVEIARHGKSLDFVFSFPKSGALSLDDKEAEFSTQLGTLKIKQRFRMKDMVYKGQLAL